MQFFIDAKLASQINLAAQIAMLVTLYIGYYFARQKKIRPHHANFQTTVVLVNLFFIFTIMAVTAYIVLKSGTPLTEHPNPFIVLHILLGIVTELLGIYLVVRMRTSWLPPNWRVKNFKRLMRITLGMWTVTVLLGLIIYASYYLGLGS